MHQLGELEDRSLSDIVHYKGCLVCVLKKVDISSTDPCDQLMDNILILSVLVIESSF